MENLHKKDNWMNPDIMYVFNKTIIEYDIKEAGYNLCREYNLLDDKRQAILDDLGKTARHVKIGKYQKADREFSSNLKDAFVNIRERFFSANSLEKADIIDIKKDAIFLTREVEVTKFGDYIQFRPKNRYSSYVRLPSRVEIFYSKDKTDVKQIGDDMLPLHENGMLSFINKMLNTIETSERAVQLRVIMNYINKYKKLELPLDFYREFNSQSKYIPADPEDIAVYDEYWDDRKEELDIHFNYFEVLLPILKMIL